MAVRGRQVSRALFAWIAGLTLALGSLGLHGGVAEHATHGLRGTMVSEAACHPFQAPHMEAPELRFHAPCSACLLKIQSVGVAPPVPAHLALPALETSGPASIAAFPPAPVRLGGSPRAPPVSPVVA